jgi:hypothetical protein
MQLDSIQLLASRQSQRPPPAYCRPGGRGFRAFDAADIQIGVYESSNSAIAALLELAQEAIAG